MKLAKYLRAPDDAAVGMVVDENLVGLDLSDGPGSLAEILEAIDPRAVVGTLIEDPVVTPLSEVSLLPPVDRQEVWAAGVTYRRSRAARVEESGFAASFYDRVYTAPRPELFMKATPHRVSGHGQPLRIRVDSAWNVPEPELTLVLNSRLELAGFTIGNDMSSRDIEGDNPLYLPQAKIYDQSAGIGPWITLADAMPEVAGIGIRLEIRRQDEIAFEGQTSIDQMVRKFDELIAWLGRDNSFPHGVLLMTGTGIVPESDFTLLHGDVVDITIDGIGTLSNPIVQG